MTGQTAELIEIAESLPLEMRAEIVNRLLESMQPIGKDVDKFWIVEAERRSDEIKSGKVKTIPGDVVFAKVKERFGR